MAIKGSLREASLPDVIQLLFMGRRTGCLAVADRQRHGSIWFHDGAIINAAIVNRRDRLGDMLLASGVVNRAQLEQALGLQAQAPGRRLGELLVTLGIITREVQRRFVQSRSDAGQSLQYLEYPAVDHMGLVKPDSPLNADLLAWTSARFATADPSAR